MSEGIQFDEDKAGYGQRRSFDQSQNGAGQSGMVQWLMNRGIAKSPAAAQTILVVAMFIFLAITFIAVF